MNASPKHLSNEKRVVFSDHAQTRCKQQDIKPVVIEKIIRRIPPFRDTITWTVPNIGKIVVMDKEDCVLVVTIVGKKKMTKQRHDMARWGRVNPLSR